ncbi:MAG: FG-GAP repeat protein, partial [Pirellula sp.]
MRSNSSWNRQQRLFANDGADGDGFGFRVALDGDTAVVGAYFAGVDGKPQQGAAYIFVRTGTTWQQQQ